MLKTFHGMASLDAKVAIGFEGLASILTVAQPCQVGLQDGDGGAVRALFKACAGVGVGM